MRVREVNMTLLPYGMDGDEFPLSHYALLLVQGAWLSLGAGGLVWPHHYYFQCMACWGSLLIHIITPLIDVYFQTQLCFGVVKEN